VVRPPSLFCRRRDAGRGRPGRRRGYACARDSRHRIRRFTEGRARRPRIRTGSAGGGVAGFVGRKGEEGSCMLVANSTHAQGSLGCVPSSPRGTAGLRREPQAPPLGTFFTAQDMSLSHGRFAGVSERRRFSRRHESRRRSPPGKLRGSQRPGRWRLASSRASCARRSRQSFCPCDLHRRANSCSRRVALAERPQVQRHPVRAGPGVERALPC